MVINLEKKERDEYRFYAVSVQVEGVENRCDKFTKYIMIFAYDGRTQFGQVCYTYSV